ncbi:MAG: NotI family restriction endonuclease [bacterium]
MNKKGKMASSKHPLAEVFGYLTTDQSPQAIRHRSHRLCPFNNKVPNCTKDKAKNPLGVCSIYHQDNPIITCPVRFREEWIIADDAASFFFDESATWSSLTEVRLNDSNGKSAGNIDVVLVAYDENSTEKSG